MKICSGSPETSPDNFFADELEEGSVEDDEAATLEKLFTSLRELEEGACHELDEVVTIHTDELDRFSDHASNALEESSPHAITKIRELKRANIRFIIVSLIAFYNRKYTITHPSSQHVYATKNLNF